MTSSAPVRYHGRRRLSPALNRPPLEAAFAFQEAVVVLLALILILLILALFGGFAVSNLLFLLLIVVVILAVVGALGRHPWW